MKSLPCDLTKHHSDDLFRQKLFLPHHFPKPKHKNGACDWLCPSSRSCKQTGKNHLCDANEAPPNDQRWLSRINSLTRRLSSISPASDPHRSNFAPHVATAWLAYHSFTSVRVLVPECVSANSNNGSLHGAESKTRGMLVGEPQRSAAGS